ncbi:Glycine betaine/carnitine/choline transport system permease protein OpuCB [Actinomadura rubteroloni]|uniref:Glycine betaine/carnitine/choline transport system permease protein OpuCB n=1 Tax=Actinomadura rubteroloni TaxID=1926885 RepID=A0A2P4UI64_9ACTN|nr:ABC transporter permease [Actinomadura rubteroloni]POM24678.1 Glycine betaine/carnitine/choline transport system permease protein OpuCB [Actinomadura rubteroloni]
MNALWNAFGWFGGAGRWSGSDGIPNRIAEHLWYSLLAFAITVAIALPLGLLLGHLRRGRPAAVSGFLVLSSANAARALPTLGLLILVVVVSTAGDIVPILVPLVLLAVPPVLVNTYAGVQQVEAGLRDAAEGMGMRGRQVLFQVELPVALPLILLGLRTALIQIVSTATIAAYVGLGGLGRYIVDGYSRQDYDSMAGGAILVIVLAVLTQAAFAALHRFAVSPGVRRAAASD